MPQRSPAGSSLATLSEVPGTELRQLQATFESFREFVERYSPWLSDSTIFAETVEPVPVGAPVRLEIFLRDRTLLIRALGQVDWVRKESDGGEDGPPGVALSITYLDPASARLIDSIFRLYTGQQSAAMGKDVVETWELDVESLIDQAFPGAGAPPEGARGAKASPKTASPKTGSIETALKAEPTKTAPTTSAPAGIETAASAAVAVAAGVAAARSVAESSEPAPRASESPPADADSLDWTLPEGVVVAEPGASVEAPAAEEEAPTADDLDWTLPEGVVVADPGPAPSTEAPSVEPSSSAPANASADRDSLDWTLPEGVVVANPDSPRETQALKIPPEVADLPEDLSDIELSDVELPDVEIPVELEESTASEKDAPAAPKTPSMPAVEPESPEVKPPATEPRVWADAELASRAVASEVVADSAAGSAAFPDSSRTVRVAMPTATSDTAEEAEWEAKFSSAFSEYEENESSDAAVVPPDAVSPEASPPVAENGGFGFGLVQESDTGSPEAGEGVSQLEPAALEPAAPSSRTQPSPPPASSIQEAPSRAQTIPIQPSPVLEQPTLEVEEPSLNAVQQVAGAASVSAESDASFLRSSLLAFLLAVVAVGLLFFWYRGRSATPSGEATVAQAPVTPSSAPEASPASAPAEAPPTSAPAEAPPTSAPAEAPPTSAPAEEPAVAPAASDPAPPAAVPEESAPMGTSAPPPPAEPVTPPPPVVAAQDSAQATSDIEQLITSWAAAWSQQDAAGYIETYGPDYSPSGLGRQDWENQRKVRIQAPESLLVLAKDISVEVLSATRAKATFYQDYETDTKHLYTWKTMDLARIGDGWRIVGERKGR